MDKPIAKMKKKPARNHPSPMPILNMSEPAYPDWTAAMITA